MAVTMFTSCPELSLRTAKQTATQRHSHIRVRKGYMSTTTTTVIGARVQPEHADQLREIAAQRGTTISRLVREMIGEKLTATRGRAKSGVRGDQKSTTRQSMTAVNVPPPDVKRRQNLAKTSANSGFSASILADRAGLLQIEGNVA